MLNLKLERQVDGDWEKLNADWPELISIWWNEAGEVALWQILSKNSHSNSSDSICSSGLNQKIESNFFLSQRVVL